MRKKAIGLLILLLSAISLSGCVSDKYVLRTFNDTNDETGMVFGRVTLQQFFGIVSFTGSDAEYGVGISFKNIETNKSFGFGEANYFFLKLPAGTYELLSLGTTAGPIMHKDRGFVFTLKPNEVRYVGAVVGDRDLLRRLKKKGIPEKEAYKEIVSHKEYGLAKRKTFGSSERVAGEPFLPLFVIDEREEAIPKFISEFPQYNQADIIIDLMH